MTTSAPIAVITLAVLPRGVLAAASARCSCYLRVVRENLAQLTLTNSCELVLNADLAERLVRLRVQLERLGMKVHLGVEKVKQCILHVL